MAKDSKAPKGAEGGSDAGAPAPGVGAPDQAPGGQVDGLVITGADTAPPAPAPAPDPLVEAQAARIAELEKEVAALKNAIEEQSVVISKLEGVSQRVAAGPASPPVHIDESLNVIFTKGARAAERRGDHAAHARLSEIAISAGALRHKVDVARGEFKGELGQIIESLYAAL